MSFQESVTKYRSIYFHFLDGLLNTKTGGNIQNVIYTLNDIAGINLDKINLASLFIHPKKTNNLIFIDFFSKNSEIYKRICIDYSDSSKEPGSTSPTSPTSPTNSTSW